MDVVFGRNAAAGHRSRFPLQRRDPVDQHERLIGEADPGRKGVGLGKGGAEHPCNLAAGEFQAHFPVEKDVFRDNGRRRCHLSTPLSLGDRVRVEAGRTGHRLLKGKLERHGVSHRPGQLIGKAEIGIVGLDLRLLGCREFTEQRLRDQRGDGLRRGGTCVRSILGKRRGHPCNLLICRDLG